MQPALSKTRWKQMEEAYVQEWISIQAEEEEEEDKHTMLQTT